MLSNSGQDFIQSLIHTWKSTRALSFLSKRHQLRFLDHFSCCHSFGSYPRESVSRIQIRASRWHLENTLLNFDWKRTTHFLQMTRVRRQDLTLTHNPEMWNQQCMNQSNGQDAHTERERGRERETYPTWHKCYVLIRRSRSNLGRVKATKWICENAFFTKGRPCIRTNRGEGYSGVQGYGETWGCDEGALWVKVRGHGEYEERRCF